MVEDDKSTQNPLVSGPSVKMHESWACGVDAGDESFIPFFAEASGNTVEAVNQTSHAKIEHTVIVPWFGLRQSQHP